MFIDAHQHYWQFDPRRDSWITDDMAVLRQDFLPDAAAPYASGGVVAVQAAQSAAETDFLLGLAARHDFIRGVVGWIDLQAPDLGDQLAARRDAARLKGFRHVAQAEPDDFLARPEIVRGIAALGRHGYSYDILVYPRQLAAAEQLVRQCPGVRFVLDHCGKPAIAAGEIAVWRTAITRLARHPNVWCKMSGLVTEATWHTWKDGDITPYLDAALEAFGADRLLFGSDWPVCLLSATYRDVIGLVERWAQRLTPGEQVRLFGATAASVYRLENRDGS